MANSHDRDLLGLDPPLGTIRKQSEIHPKLSICLATDKLAMENENSEVQNLIICLMGQ